MKSSTSPCSTSPLSKESSLSSPTQIFLKETSEFLTESPLILMK